LKKYCSKGQLSDRSTGYYANFSVYPDISDLPLVNNTLEKLLDNRDTLQFRLLPSSYSLGTG